LAIQIGKILPLTIGPGSDTTYVYMEGTMGKRGNRIYLLVLAVLLLISSGCGQEGLFNEEETIIVQNRSGVNGVQIYINGEYKGTVDNNRDLTAKDSNWDDEDIWIEARTSVCEWEKIPLTMIYSKMDDGDTYTWKLGMPKQSPGCWEGPGSITSMS
jgi:hypothetical protein